MSTSKDRLLAFLSYLRIGQNAFEKKVGISNGYISRSKGSFGSKIIANISNTYPELNTLWLLTGEGEMLKPKSEGIETNTTDVISIPISVWGVISNQAESLKSKDRQLDAVLESLKVKDRQTTEVIELLKEQIKKGGGVDENYHAAIQAVGE